MKSPPNPFGAELFAAGACNQPGVDPETFHSGVAADIDRAKAICHRCPVRAQCLIAADVAATLGQEMEAVLGGMTLTERKLRRRIRRLQESA